MARPKSFLISWDGCPWGIQIAPGIFAPRDNKTAERLAMHEAGQEFCIPRNTFSVEDYMALFVALPDLVLNPSRQSPLPHEAFKFFGRHPDVMPEYLATIRDAAKDVSHVHRAMGFILANPDESKQIEIATRLKVGESTIKQAVARLAQMSKHPINSRLLRLQKRNKLSDSQNK